MKFNAISLKPYIICCLLLLLAESFLCSFRNLRLDRGLLCLGSFHLVLEIFSRISLWCPRGFLEQFAWNSKIIQIDTFSISPSERKKTWNSFEFQRCLSFDTSIKKNSNPLFLYSTNDKSFFPMTFLTGSGGIKHPGHLLTRNSLR